MAQEEAGRPVEGSRGVKLGRRKVKTSWCFGVVRVTGVSEAANSSSTGSALIAGREKGKGWIVVGRSRSPYSFQRDRTRASQEECMRLFWKEATATEREGQMSRRNVDIRVWVEPPGGAGGFDVNCITGSIRISVVRRRGCMRDKFTLRYGSVLVELQKLVCVGLFGDRHLSATHTMPNAYQWSRHLVPEMVDHV